MENTCGYSDNWQPYIGDYDKFEYDVKLKSGEIIENCYPNGGYFNQLDSDVSVIEGEVAEIRFSNTPISFLANKFSQFEISGKLIEEQKRRREELIEEADRKRRGRKAWNTLAAAYSATLTFPHTNFTDYQNFDCVLESKGGSSEPAKYCTRWVDIRTEPKIGRNDICPKCDSGKKFKKCCGKTV